MRNLRFLIAITIAIVAPGILVLSAEQNTLTTATHDAAAVPVNHNASVDTHGTTDDHRHDAIHDHGTHAGHAHGHVGILPDHDEVAIDDLHAAALHHFGFIDEGHEVL
ncbi:MAG: hypothetical protein QOE68_3391, partial [Thermoanaerobaculia bacterium]|nr:hypothetical protein [Thermoanaerobaculia bacterium]